MQLSLLQCCAKNLIHVAFKHTQTHADTRKKTKQFAFISSQPGNFRFSNHIYLGQENLRCLCLTRWLANQGWLHWGLGHPKSATNIIEPWSNLVYLSEKRQLTRYAQFKSEDVERQAHSCLTNTNHIE